MRRQLTLLFCAGLVVSAAGGAAVAATDAGQSVQIRDVDSSAFPVVTFTVATQGSVDPSQITVTEGGANVQAPSVLPLATSGQGVDVVLAIDTSGSMQGAPLASAIDAAKRFLSSANPQVGIGVVTFADKAHVVQAITTDHAAVLRALDSAKAAGETALYDGVIAATRMFSGTEQRNIVLLTDGRDTVSKGTLRSATSAANRGTVAIFSIGLKTPDTDFSSLKSMSQASSGRFVAAAQADLGSVYQQILTVLTHQYRVTYRSHARRGTQVEIAVTTPLGSDSFLLTVPRLSPLPSPTQPASPQPKPFHFSEPLLRGAWGMAVALGLLFIAIYSIMLLALGPGIRKRREQELARRAGIPPPPATSTRRGERTLAAFVPTLVAAGDRLANAGGFTLALEAKLERAGLPLTPGEIVASSLLSAILGAIIGAAGFGGPVLGAIFAIVFAAMPLAIVHFMALRRMNKLHAQLPDILMILATSLRAGHSFLQALDTASKEAADPGAREFARVVAEVRLGRPLDEALNAMGDRVGSDDFRWAVLAVNIQREVGGNLAEVLDTVADTLREREALRRQIDTLSTEGKLSVYILIGLPILIGLWILKFNRDYLSLLFHTTGGLMMLGGSGVLMVVGYLWMRKIVNIDV